MKSLFSKVKVFTIKHKLISAVIVLICFFVGNWTLTKLTSTDGETRYVTANAVKGTVITTVTGSGQVSTLNQIDIKPKASGEIISILVTGGQSVKAGQVIARIDATDALKAVRDAEVNLETAKLSLQKILEPVDELSLTQSDNSLSSAYISEQSAKDSLAKTYNDGFNEISNAFLDLPSIVSGLHDLLFSTNNLLGGNNVNNIDFYASTANLYDQRGEIYGKDADTKYQIALAKYNTNFADYKTLDRNASTSTIEETLKETYETTLAISDAVKSTNNLIQFYQDQMTQHNQKIPSLSNTQLNTLNNYTGTANQHLSSLLSLQNSLQSNKNSLTQSAQQIKVSTLSLAKLKAGADALDIRNQEITVTSRENALKDAQIALADYSVRAPFSGVLAKVSAKVGDFAGSGSGIATVIANQQIAELSLNEIDAAKVKVGQKATLTFDAVADLSISGEVATIDTLGTVTQGVVTYAVQINFDSQDSRVKSGMSVNATIQTAVKTDVLTVPSSAVKAQGTTNYVLVFNPPLSNAGGNQGVVSLIAPTRQTVTIGLADDASTEIVSGIEEGDQVVTKTTTVTSPTSTKTSAPSLIGGGSTRGIGGGFRGN